METPREVVLKYYSQAHAVNVTCKNGSYYHIISDNRPLGQGSVQLGQGKSAKAAWKSALRNLEF